MPLQHIRCAAVTIPLIGKHVREADRESRILKRSTRSCLDVLALQARGERLRQLVGFLRVRHSQRVHVLRAPDLELGAVGALADLHKLGVPPSRLLEEVADVCDQLRPAFYEEIAVWREREREREVREFASLIETKKEELP